jgi:hypothetical protein
LLNGEQQEPTFHRLAEPTVGAEDLEEQSTRRSLVPTLVVGLGGTGAEVACRLKKKLLATRGRAGRNLEMTKFQIFDTVSANKQQNKDISRLFSESEEEYVCLSTNFNAYEYLKQNYAKDPDLRDWWDNRYSVSPQYQEWGAKRVRQLGRLFLHHRHLQVESMIQQKVSDTCTIYEELVRGENLAEVGSNFRVYVMTSTCGGTGSGIFLDMLYKIWRAVLSQGRVPEIRAFMFLPGVYEEETRKRSLELVQAHRANAYAFLKEVDYFLTPGSDINQYILDAKTRDSSQQIMIPPGSLFKYGYLIDRQLGNLGNLDKPEDAYNLVADGIYQMMITPVGQEEEGVGLTNIDVIVDPAHRREGKRTAYSSLGLSRILFPRSTLHAHLTYNFLRDLIYLGLTPGYSWMDEMIRKDKQVDSLVELFSQKNFDSLDELTRSAMELVAQCPSQTDLQAPDFGSHFDKLIKEKDLNEARLVEGISIIDNAYQGYIGQAQSIAHSAIVNLVNNSRYGVIYAQKILFVVRKRLRQLIDQLREQRAEYQSLKAEAEKDLNNQLQALEKVFSKRAVLFRGSQASRRASEIATDMRTIVETAFVLRITEKKLNLLEALAGQEQLVEQKLADEEIVVERRVEKSLIDREIDKINRIVEQLNDLGDSADRKAKRWELADEDAGATITTQMFPPHVTNFMRSPALRAVYEKEVNTSTAHDHLQTILQKISEQEGSISGIYQLSDEETATATRQLIVSTVSDYTKNLFKDILGLTVVEAAERSIGKDRFAEQAMANLFELSQPCWNYDSQKAQDPGMTELPRTYSLGYEDPESLPIPEGRYRPGLVKTQDNHQITLLQAQHGLPLFALRLLSSLRADYKKYMREARSSGLQPLHLNQHWTKDINLLPDIKVPLKVTDEVLKDFALGLFCDYLIIRRDPAALSLVRRRPVDENQLRGHVFTINGRDYFANRLTDKKKFFQIESQERISSSGRLDAAEVYANLKDLAEVGAAFVRQLENKKQYVLVDDLKEYLEKMIIPEIKRIDDDEEKEILKREYRVLKAYLDELVYRKERGLPLAS